jgi:hypothetical protein
MDISAHPSAQNLRKGTKSDILSPILRVLMLTFRRTEPTDRQQKGPSWERKALFATITATN